ncbi:MAG TPA: glycoside hydrolase family 9 protein, partial [Balneolaceae bacterium]|nr:glycoside hydrolase family 9 protein [Balneolaceae bacterium]
QAGGVNVFVFNNSYSREFGDSKKSGIELIQDGKRIVTNGDVRLSNTPEQWDPVSVLSNRTIKRDKNAIQVALSYPDYHFHYSIHVREDGGSFLISVYLNKPLPKKLQGRAGFNLDFLPTAYFGKSYLIDGRSGLFPRHPFGPMHKAKTGKFEASPLSKGSTLVMSPGNASTRIKIKAVKGHLALYDARNKAQNGWYVVRSLLPANKKGKVVEWKVTPNITPGWKRKPVIGHSQIGYTPGQKKVAIIEEDPNDNKSREIELDRLLPNGKKVKELSGKPKTWGKYLRYKYKRFNFSSVRQPGVYVLKYGNQQTRPFRIAKNVFKKNVWQSTLATFLPVQMDHVFVNDRYRVWHGLSHMDDARQAPINHKHFDMYRQGDSTDTRFKSGQHIPGLNVGGWFDAGDYDIRTQSQYAVVLTLVHAEEAFHIKWDETSVNEKNRYVNLHHPDGVPDIIQQIQHGTLQLLSQFKVVGHAINGIISPTLQQYTLLGDAATQTDNKIYDPSLDSLQTKGKYSGRPDDRWAFTNKSTPLDYGSIAALAAASRVLKGYNDTLATQSRQTAIRVWKKDHSQKPVIFKSGNTTGGPLKTEEMKAAMELLITTKGDQKYANRIKKLWPYVKKHFYRLGGWAARAIPYMDASYKQNVRAAVENYKNGLKKMKRQNPYGVPITKGGWGGSGTVLQYARLDYQLHRAFPSLISPRPVFRAMDYVLGTHPVNNISMVEGVGAYSQTNAYSSNRADYSFIPGGIIPGVLIIKPNFPELKTHWPFLWYENENVITEGALFIYVANAAEKLTSK